MWFTGPVRNFGMRRTCRCQHPGCQHVGTNCTPLGRDQRGDPSESSQALTCHPAVVIYCQPCHEAVICLSVRTNPGQSACGGTLHPLGRSGRGGTVETSQALTYHPAVVIFCQPCHEAVICLSLPTLDSQHAEVTCTPWDAVAAATLQKPHKPWLVIQQLWFTVSHVMRLSFS